MKDFIELDFNDSEFDHWLHQTVDLISNANKDLSNKKVFRNRNPEALSKVFQAALPETGQSMDSILSELKTHVIEEATLNIGPHFYSYVLSPGNQAGLLADFVSSYLNQNTAKWHLNSAGAEIEKVVTQWIAEFIGYQKTASGIFLSGGSTANLVCLNVARNKMAGYDVNSIGVFTDRPMTVYVSDQVHYCIEKSCATLGIGTDHVRKIPSLDDYTMDVVLLEKTIQKDLESGFHPICVVGSAGTVNTGAVDPLVQISEICVKYNLWFHIDAAYGGPAAAIPSYQELFKGLDQADSVAVDPHKWLYVPLEAGCALFKNLDDLRATYSFIPEYLVGDRKSERMDFMEYGPQLTRSFKALKTWVTLKYYGAEKLRQAIHDDIRKVEYIGKELKQRNDFEVLSAPALSIICFRYNPKTQNLSTRELNSLNDQLIDQLEIDGKVFITGTTIKGNRALRVCIVNHRTQKEHLDFMLETVHKTATRILLPKQ